MANPATGLTLDVPGARLHYDVQGSGPVLMMIGLPAPADAFAALAVRLSNSFTVVRYDPRGIARSTVDDPEQVTPLDVYAEDVRRVLAEVADEPVAVFGSSGGASTGLALVARHPELVRVLVAHEPPLVGLLTDAAQAEAAIQDVYDTYRREGQQAAWPKFFAATGIQPPPRAAGQPPPSEQDVANGERMLSHCVMPTMSHRPDVDALRGAPTRIVPAGGRESAGQLAHRGAVALAEHLDRTFVDFPGDHGGFNGEPDAFAATLRTVLLADAAD